MQNFSLEERNASLEERIELEEIGGGDLEETEGSGCGVCGCAGGSEEFGGEIECRRRGEFPCGRNGTGGRTSKRCR
jgi:hypothetical protein